MRHYWVDRVRVEEPGVRGTGRKAVSFSEDFFTDHFPGNPVFPGIYLIEGMAQTAGAIITHGSGGRLLALLVSVDRARFSSFVRPGDVVEYEIVVEERTEEFARVQSNATVSGRTVAQGRLTLRVLEFEEMIPPSYREEWSHTLDLAVEASEEGEDEHLNR